MPLPNDYRDIVSSLTQRTEQGLLTWANDNNQIAVVLENAKFALWSGSDERTDEPYIAFGLYDIANKKFLDSWYVDESDPDYFIVQRLHQSARRYANGIHILLDKVAGTLAAMANPPA